MSSTYVGKDISFPKLTTGDNEKKEVASRFYQLLTGHAVIAPYLKEKLKKTEFDAC
ncbi:hypothetical protein FPQ18DRAFT_392212 [Pyronema domesticum]|nr:hypothetical protein FPQ18DRAFT_392212 [Pyronema domesticum]